MHCVSNEARDACFLFSFRKLRFRSPAPWLSRYTPSSTVRFARDAHSVSRPVSSKPKATQQLRTKRHTCPWHRKFPCLSRFWKATKDMAPNLTLRSHPTMDGAVFRRVWMSHSSWLGPHPHRTHNATQSKWNLCAWMGVFTLHARTSKGLRLNLRARARVLFGLGLGPWLIPFFLRFFTIWRKCELRKTLTKHCEGFKTWQGRSIMHF